MHVTLKSLFSLYVWVPTIDNDSKIQPQSTHNSGRLFKSSSIKLSYIYLSLSLSLYIYIYIYTLRIKRNYYLNEVIDLLINEYLVI